MRTLHPLQLEAECNIVPATAGGVALTTAGFHHQQLSIDAAGGMLSERAALSELECDVDTLKKLKLGARSSLWSRPASTTSQLQHQQQQQQQRQLKTPPLPQQPQQLSQPPQQQPTAVGGGVGQQPRPHQSPAPTPKLLSEKSDYSISV